MAKAKRATALKAKASGPAATRQKPKGIAKKPVARKPPAARKAPAKPQVSQASKRTSRKAASKKPAAAAAKPEAKKATTKQTGKPASAVRTRAPTKRFVDEQAAAVAKSKKPAARATAKKPAAAKKPVAAAKPVVAKPLAAKPAAAPALRRNTTLQTRGKDQSAGLRPVSRSTGAPVGAKPKPAAQPPVTPTQAKRPAPASVDAVAPARKRARMAAEASTAAASVAHVPKARLSAVAPAVQKARQSSGGASLKAAAGGKTDAASPRADKGKSPADVSDSSQASSSGRRQTPGAPASAGAGGASSTGASSKQTALLTDVRMYYNYSRQGSKGVLRFATSGDRRDKVRVCVSALPGVAVAISVTCVSHAHSLRSIVGRQKHPWRDDEVQALSDGVATYSKSWAAILRANPQSFHASRTPVDLKVASVHTLLSLNRRANFSRIARGYSRLTVRVGPILGRVNAVDVW